MNNKKNNLLINYSWLNLTPQEIFKEKVNPLQNLVTDNPVLLENPQLFLATILSLPPYPEYLYFICKYILNIQLLPFQLVILSEMWYKPFPMLIATRGGSKTFLLAVYSILRALILPGRKIVIVGAAFRQSKYVMQYCEKIFNEAPILRDLFGAYNRAGRESSKDPDRWKLYLGRSEITSLPLGDGCLAADTQITYNNYIDTISNNNITDKNWYKIKNKIWSNGQFRNSPNFYCNGLSKVMELTTKKGFKIVCTPTHKFKILRNQDIIWEECRNITSDDHILIDRTPRWHNNYTDVTPEQAYALGAMIGDGSWVNKYYLRFTNIDIEIVNKVIKGIPFIWNQQDDKHWNANGIKNVTAWKNFWNLDICYTKDKYIPIKMLSSSKDCMTECLRGLFDTDGCIQVTNKDDSIGGIVSFCSISRKLVYQIQYILLHYGIISNVSSRVRAQSLKNQPVKTYNRIYELFIYGQNLLKFFSHIGFGVSKKQKLLKYIIKYKKRWSTINDGVPNIIKDIINIRKNNRLKKGSNNKKFDSICASKLVNQKYATRDMIHKFCTCYEYLDNPIIDKIKLLADSNIYYDRIQSIKNVTPQITYDMYIPDGNEYCANGFFSHNSKIRGERANDIITDEMSSIVLEIYETVVQGFAAVTANPASNVIEKAKTAAMETFGIDDDEDKINQLGNQSIISGTAYYDFNHFADYFRKYRNILRCRNDIDKLSESFGEDILSIQGLDYNDFLIFRIPYELLPNGFLDDKTVARAKATIHSGTFAMEYQACFTKDSHGFFKRSLIESCVCPVNIYSGTVDFIPSLIGQQGISYVFGVDPAADRDNFAIVILELHPDHTRIVYCWSTNRKRHRELIKEKLTTEEDYYAFCARKIRNLMKRFRCVHIACDSQGGGAAIEEILHDKDKLFEGEQLIWQVIDPDKPKDSDDKAGLHILEMINFAKADWTNAANHGLRNDLEHKFTLFPMFDPISLELSVFQDEQAIKRGDKERVYDTLEDCVFEIEELKNELTIITMTQTPNGRDKWDTPEIKLPGGKKGRLVKDRYSALLMANMAARTINRSPVAINYDIVGKVADRRNPEKAIFGQMYTGPDWFTSKLGDNLFNVIKR